MGLSLSALCGLYHNFFLQQAYKNFGSRVRALKRKLDELVTTLPNAAPSPPARDEDVPSPSPDEDLELPPPTDNDAEDDSEDIIQIHLFICLKDPL